jgi:hypothetical protein
VACDLLVMVGTNFPFPGHLPEAGCVEGAQLDDEPTRKSASQPCACTHIARERWVCLADGVIKRL